MANLNQSLLHPQPLLVEVIGPAGAGKTTLINSLIQLNQKIYKVSKPSFRSVRNLTFLTRNGISLFPILINLRRNSWFNDREIWWMIYLNEMHSTLGSKEFTNYIMGLIDHGPIYMLTSLYMMDLGENRDQDFKQWWKKKLNEWTSYLDAIIWLDAPNSALIERINERETEHPIKGFPEADMGRFLNRYREAYVQVISIIKSNGHQIELIKANTATESSKQIENRILEVLMRFSNEK